MPTRINLKIFSDNNNVKVSCERTTHRYGDDKYHSNIGYVNAIFKNGRDTNGKFAKPQVN